MQQHTGTKLEEGPTQLRCIGCGALRQSAGRDFRCPDCGDLLAVIYPDWKSSKHGSALQPNNVKKEARKRPHSRAFARLGGFRWVACASTGNTSASMAAYAARGGMRSVVLIPEGQVSWGKLSQALDYGAVTCQLKTDFDGCMRVLNEVVQRMPVCL